MQDVVIVGAGVIGLSCAMRLQQAGLRVAVVAADEPELTTSWVAAAVWYPTHTDADPRVLRWARATYTAFTEQAAQGVPGITARPTRMLLRGSTATPWWASAVPDFALAPDVPAGYTGVWAFTVPAVEMSVYLPWQIQQVTAAGGTFVRRRVERWADVADLAPVTINATGLAARDLAGDPGVHPARGRIVVVSNPGLHTSIRDEDNPAGMTYIHPRPHDVVLGGTFEPHEWDLTPDEDESRAILARCTALVPELAQARVIAQVAGLRPVRADGVRLEPDPAQERLIHVYGHGGAGMTLSWGCADDVTALVSG
jgi:D-amino-acid oxidase